MNQLPELQKQLKYQFKNPQLLETAITHSSCFSSGQGENEHNQRLEFFGDAVLELCTSEYLYHNYVNMNEGAMTRLRSQMVCENALYSVALLLDLGKYLKLSKGEDSTNGRNKPSILSDALEAVIGAIYLDGGLISAQSFVWHYAPELAHSALAGKLKDAKTRLQELVQKDGNVKIEYVLMGEAGLQHEKVFEVCVKIQDCVQGIGKGKSKKEAEQFAAEQALLAIE